jgi:ATP-dependent Clp endopeptidase proteolytic subunit ClpP
MRDFQESNVTENNNRPGHEHEGAAPGHHDESGTAGPGSQSQRQDPFAPFIEQLAVVGEDGQQRPLNDAERQLASFVANAAVQMAMQGMDARAKQVGLEKAVAEGQLAMLTGQKTSVELQLLARQAQAEMRVHAAPLRIPFNGMVNRVSMAQMQQILMTSSDMFPGRPIELWLNSEGGSIVDGLMLYNIIGWLRTRGHHVTVVAVGQAASMGGILLQAADWRVIGPDARILIHMPSGGVMGNIKEWRTQLKLIEGMWQQTAERLAARSNVEGGAEAIKAKAENEGDIWLTAQEALEMGFVDAILEVPNPKTSTPPPKPEDLLKAKKGNEAEGEGDLGGVGPISMMPMVDGGLGFEGGPDGGLGENDKPAEYAIMPLSQDKLKSLIWGYSNNNRIGAGLTLRKQG